MSHLLSLEVLNPIPRQLNLVKNVGDLKFNNGNTKTARKTGTVHDEFHTLEKMSGSAWLLVAIRRLSLWVAGSPDRHKISDSDELDMFVCVEMVLSAVIRLVNIKPGKCKQMDQYHSLCIKTPVT